MLRADRLREERGTAREELAHSKRLMRACFGEQFRLGLQGLAIDVALYRPLCNAVTQGSERYYYYEEPNLAAAL